VHCPLMSMPYIFKTDVDTVPCPIPYIRPWNWEVNKMWERYPRRDGLLRVGINWAGNPKYKKDATRSFSLSEFAALAAVGGIELFSLQKGPAARQIEKYKDRVTVIDASSDAHDFAESAALVSTLDLIITSDSSPMHLAAAMGKEVWLLLAYQPDWRWGDSGETTPWYPTVHIFRQASNSDWAGIFINVRKALEEKMNVVRMKDGQMDRVVLGGVAESVAINASRMLNMTTKNSGFSYITKGEEEEDRGASGYTESGRGGLSESAQR
jgi:Glycosyltransferase family 9 (heptosyltransferase)